MRNGFASLVPWAHVRKALGNPPVERKAAGGRQLVAGGRHDAQVASRGARLASKGASNAERRPTPNGRATLARAINHRRPQCHSHDGEGGQHDAPIPLGAANTARNSLRKARKARFDGYLQTAGATLARAIDHRRHQCRSYGPRHRPTAASNLARPAISLLQQRRRAGEAQLHRDTVVGLRQALRPA